MTIIDCNSWASFSWLGHSRNALYLPFAILYDIGAIWVVLFVIAAILSEVAGILTLAIGKMRRYDGPMGKSDRAFVMGCLSLVLSFGVYAKGWVDALFILLMVLSLWTAWRRCQKGLAC